MTTVDVILSGAWPIPIDLWLLNGTVWARLESFWMTTHHHRLCFGMPPRHALILANYNQTGGLSRNYSLDITSPIPLKVPLGIFFR